MNKGTALDQETGQKLIFAIRRLTELGKTKIVNPNTEAEKAGLQKFVNDTVIAHADELTACWSAVRFEYEPFVGTMSLVMDRISSIK